MKNKLKEVFERAQSWPHADQEEPADYAGHIESRRNKAYHATADELRALAESDRSGVASEQEIETAFRSFHPA
jgi:hypothetical protein